MLVCVFACVWLLCLTVRKNMFGGEWTSMNEKYLPKKCALGVRNLNFSGCAGDLLGAISTLFDAIKFYFH